MSSIEQMVQVHQLRVWIRESSPPIRYRLLVSNDGSLPSFTTSDKLCSAGRMSTCTSLSFGESSSGSGNLRESAHELGILLTPGIRQLLLQ
jgi:hypothetical protein